MNIVWGLQRKYNQFDAANSWLDRKACLGSALPEPRAVWPKDEVQKFHVLNKRPMLHKHHDKPAKEIQAIQCSPFLVGWENMFREWAS